MLTPSGDPQMDTLAGDNVHLRFLETFDHADVAIVIRCDDEIAIRSQGHSSRFGNLISWRRETQAIAIPDIPFRRANDKSMDQASDIDIPNIATLLRRDEESATWYERHTTRGLQPHARRRDAVRHRFVGRAISCDHRELSISTDSVDTVTRIVRAIACSRSHDEGSVRIHGQIARASQGLDHDFDAARSGPAFHIARTIEINQLLVWAHPKPPPGTKSVWFMNERGQLTFQIHFANPLIKEIQDVNHTVRTHKEAIRIVQLYLGGKTLFSIKTTHMRTSMGVKEALSIDSKHTVRFFVRDVKIPNRVRHRHVGIGKLHLTSRSALERGLPEILIIIVAHPRPRLQITIAGKDTITV